MGRVSLGWLVAIVLVSAGCARPSAPATLSEAPATATTAMPSTNATSTTVDAGFNATVSPVTAADLPASWRPGCPVGPEQLRLLRLTHWDFDGRPATGVLVVSAAQTDNIVAVFRQLYDHRFPIRRMERVDTFGGDDRTSMAADNTSAFNCRNAVASGPPRWSAHAFGEAIDINPVENPYLQGGEVQPPAGAAFVERSNHRPGMAVEGGVVVAAFASVGWSWGGRWTATPDYQHFSSTGA